MTQPGQNHESQDRRSRRFKWLVLGGFALAALLTLAGVLFIPWDVKPPDAPDLVLNPRKLQPADNAFTYLESASKLAVFKFKGQNNRERDWCVLFNAMGSAGEQWDPKFADEILAANAAAFPELEKALACRHYAGPLLKDYASLAPWLQHNKMLACLLCLKSKRAQLAGNQAEAAQAGLQAFGIGQLMIKDANSLLEWLIGLGCQNWALSRLEELVADANTSEPVLRLILAELNRWDPQELSQGCRQAFQGEYRASDITIRELARREDAGSDFEEFRLWSWIPYTLKPNMTRHRLVPYWRNMIAKADKPYAKICLEKSPDIMAFDKQQRIALLCQPNFCGKVFVYMTTLGSNKVFSKKCYIPAWVDALRLKIALRLYEQKHGQLPDDLGTLVPEYIQAIPQDPYDDQPFRYSKAEKKVWSVGHNLVDDGGETEDHVIMGGRNTNPDQVMPLGTRELKPTLAPVPVP
jgi:hypothetical protein